MVPDNDREPYMAKTKLIKKGTQSLSTSRFNKGGRELRENPLAATQKKPPRPDSIRPQITGRNT